MNQISTGFTEAKKRLVLLRDQRNKEIEAIEAKIKAIELLEGDEIFLDDKTIFTNEIYTVGAKGSVDWDKYTYQIIKSTNKQRRADFVDVALKFNPNMKRITIEKAIGKALRNLVRDKKLKSTPLGNNPKDGNEYTML